MDSLPNMPIVHERGAAPKSAADTGVDFNNLLRLLLKTIYVRGLETGSQLSAELKLPLSIVNELLDESKDRDLTEIFGSAGLSLSSEFRLGLTAKGREWATEALAQSLYIGPAPVSLDDFRRQVERQKLTAEQVARDSLVQGLSELVVSDSLIRTLGPAINAGRSILLYGSPGNGKTTIAEVIGHLFKDIIHVPHCIDVDGQIIKFYDQSLHVSVEDEYEAESGGGSVESLRASDIDRRWVAVRRPLAIAGGELTLAMLDLKFNPYSRFYEAPLHMKAIGGTFVVDDLGRQLVRPDDLLNRWIGPMETRIDYLSLNTGRTFSIPFDEMLVFSTNLLPEDIMDPAFLRRIPYKIGLPAPTEEEFLQTLQQECLLHGLESDDRIGRHIMHEIQERYKMPLAFYQPKFLVQQVVQACRYEGRAAEFEPELIAESLQHLSPRSEDLGMKRVTYAWDNKDRGPEEYTPLDQN
jgi:hypothetical protein